MFRGEPIPFERRAFLIRGAVLVGAAVLAGLATGAVVGTVSDVLGGSFRRGAAWALAILAVVLVLDVAGFRQPIPQRNVETSIVSYDRRVLRWGVYTGAMLGFGGLTRLGFWAWYLIPLSILMSGSPFVGAAIWGTYGGVRTVSSLVLGYRRFTAGSGHRAAWALLSMRPSARVGTDVAGVVTAAILLTTHLL